MGVNVSSDRYVPTAVGRSDCQLKATAVSVYRRLYSLLALENAVSSFLRNLITLPFNCLELIVSIVLINQTRFITIIMTISEASFFTKMI